MSAINKIKEYKYSKKDATNKNFIYHILFYKHKVDRKIENFYLTKEKEKELLQVIPLALKTKNSATTKLYKNLFSFLLKEISINNSVSVMGYKFSKNENSLITRQSSKLFFLSNRIKYNDENRRS
mgnify:CR=1 FL=1